MEFSLFIQLTPEALFLNIQAYLQVELHPSWLKWFFSKFSDPRTLFAQAAKTRVEEGLSHKSVSAKMYWSRSAQHRKTNLPELFEFR